MKWDEKYSSLELKCDDLEQESRLTSVIILNEWVEQPTESTTTMAKQYIQEALHIDVHDNDILKCFRISDVEIEPTEPSNQGQFSSNFHQYHSKRKYFWLVADSENSCLTATHDQYS